SDEEGLIDNRARVNHNRSHTPTPLLSVTTYSRAELGEMHPDFAIFKDRVLRTCQANFIRIRKPSTKRVLALVQTIVPEINDWSGKTAIFLKETAKKAFENSRNDFMTATRKIAAAVKSQLVRCVLRSDVL